MREDPASDDPDAPRRTHQQDLWHYTIARMVDACVSAGILPYYGPFGDITDTVACEDQFRNAYLLGCGGAWTMHPVQIEIARRVFSPRPSDVAQALRVIDAMGDGTGVVLLDGRMEDDASANNVGSSSSSLASWPPATPNSRPHTGSRDRERTSTAPVGVVHAGGQRACPREGEDDPGGCIDLRPRGRVAPDAKPTARVQACAAAASGAYGHREITIRCNGLDTEWGVDDLRAAATSGAAAMVIPKVGSTRDLDSVSAELDAAGAPPEMRIWAMVETPTAILDVRAIAAHPRVGALVMGTNDLAKELRAAQVPGRAPLVPHLATALLAARESGKVILDGVFNDVHDAEGFRRECEQGAELGFDGKTLIHPGQVDIANDVWAPGDDEIAQARRVIEAFDRRCPTPRCDHRLAGDREPALDNARGRRPRRRIAGAD